MSRHLFEVVIGCYIFNNEGKMLLLENRRGTWGILGGHLEEGETPKDAVIREVKEEANIEVKIGPLIAVRTFKNTVGINYVCKYVSGEIKLQVEEVKDFKWVELGELSNFKLTFPELEELATKAKTLADALF